MITIANMGYHTESELIYCSQQYLLRSLSTFGVTMNIVTPPPPPHLQIRSVLPSLCHLLIYLGVLVPSTTPSASPPSPQLFRLQQQPAGTVSYPSAPLPRKREAERAVVAVGGGEERAVPVGREEVRRLDTRERLHRPVRRRAGGADGASEWRQSLCDVTM